VPYRRYNWTRDEIILACDLVASNRWASLPNSDQSVVALSRLLRSANIHPADGRAPEFRSVDSVARKTVDIATRHPAYSGTPTNGNGLDRVVLADFLNSPAEMSLVAGRLREALTTGAGPLPSGDDEGDDEGHREGAVLWALHKRRERSPALRRRKLAQARQMGVPIACEVCSFDFEHSYGPRGRDYIEVHHVLPLHASGPTTTRLSDLVMLCSNCHRMIHRGNPWLTPDGLRAVLRPT
jgi:5-methylcytosine-specific restriction protein A